MLILALSEKIVNADHKFFVLDTCAARSLNPARRSAQRGFSRRNDSFVKANPELFSWFHYHCRGFVR